MSGEVTPDVYIPQVNEEVVFRSVLGHNHLSGERAKVLEVTPATKEDKINYPGGFKIFLGFHNGVCKLEARTDECSPIPITT